MRLDPRLLSKLAERAGKSVKTVREQVSRRGSREGVASEVALIIAAREQGIGVLGAVNKLSPHLQQQLSVPRVAPAPQIQAGSRAVKTPTKGRVTPRTMGVKAPANSWVFISHSSTDVSLVRALIRLLREALNIPADRILCTSVPGHRIPGGSKTDDVLKAEVLGCKTVIGVITPASRASAYVLFELGARWGAGKHLIALTAKGVAPGELRGPIAATNALDCALSADVYQLVGDVGTSLGMDPDRPEVYTDRVSALVRQAKKK